MTATDPLHMLSCLGRRFHGADLSFRRQGTNWPAPWRARLHATKNERAEFRMEAFGGTPEASIAALLLRVEKLTLDSFLRITMSGLADQRIWGEPLAPPATASKEKSMGFKFILGEKVSLVVSGETGEVIGRAEYTASIRSYLVRYRSADGRAVEAWWQEDALRSAE